MESFQSMLFRYTTSGILSCHFDTNQHMIECINQDMERVKGGESVECVINDRQKERGVCAKLLDNGSHKENKVFRKSASSGFIDMGHSEPVSNDLLPKDIILNAIWSEESVNKNSLKLTDTSIKRDVKKERRTLRGRLFKKLNFI